MLIDKLENFKFSNQNLITFTQNNFANDAHD